MEKLGINLSAFLFQLLNFSIVLIVLGKMVYPKFLAMLDERRNKIQEGLEKSASITAELAGIETTKKQEVSKTQAESATILKQSRDEAEKLKKSVLEDASEKAKAIIAEAELEATKRKEEAMKSFADSAVELAMIAVKQIVKADTGTIDQNKILADSLEEFKRTYNRG